MLSHKQQGVLRGVIAAIATAVVAIAAAIMMHPVALLPAEGEGSALAHALKWDTLVVLCLLVNIGLMAGQRFVSPTDIDGAGLTQASPKAKVLQSILQNTLEQTVLAVTTHAIWAVTTPNSWQAAVPVAAILFVVGRALFWRGYTHGAQFRAFGFGLTFQPSVVLLLLIAGRLLLLNR